jgi:hypothetical protein
LGPDKNPLLSWAAIVVPGFATALSWPLTTGLPFVNRVAVGVAVALAIYAVIYLASRRGSGRDDTRNR